MEKHCFVSTALKYFLLFGAETGDAFWDGLCHYDRWWRGTHGPRRSDCHAQSVRLGQHKSAWVSCSISCGDKKTERVMLWRTDEDDVSLCFRLLLFVDEADAFLRKRSTVSLNLSIQSLDVKLMMFNQLTHFQLWIKSLLLCITGENQRRPQSHSECVLVSHWRTKQQVNTVFIFSLFFLHLLCSISNNLPVVSKPPHLLSLLLFFLQIHAGVGQ